MTPAGMDTQTRLGLERNLRKFYLFRFFVNMQLWLPIWVIYLTEGRGFSLTQVTALDGPFWLALVALEVPTGAIADRFGRRHSLYLGALAYAIAVVVFAVSSNYAIIMVSYLAWAAAFTLFSGADAAFIYDTLKALGREGEYQRIWGKSQAFVTTGAIAGTLLGAPLAELTNLHTPILLSSVFLFAAWLVAVRFVEPPRFHEGEVQLGYMASIKEATAICIRRPVMRTVILFTAAFGALSMSTFILTQPFLRHHDISVGNVGWFLLPGQLVSIVVALNAHRLTARFGADRVLMALPLITMAAMIGLGTVDSILAVAFFPVNSFAYALSMPVISDYLNRRIPGGQRATILSLQNLVLSLLLAGIEPIMGLVADDRGFDGAFRLGAVLIACTAAPLMILWTRAAKSEPPLEPIAAAEAAG